VSERTVPQPLFAGAAIASFGGPLALVALYLPAAAGGAIRSSTLVVALALVVFAAPLLVWLIYSRAIVSSGGLSAFVEAAVGRRAARVHAAVWTVSYFLYLPYTVTYIVYDVAPVVFPGVTPYRTSLELALPAAIFALVLAPLRFVLGALAVAALGQLALAAALGVLALRNSSGDASALTSHVHATALGRGVGGVALLFVCGSLPLFFGTEVQGGARAVRRGLAFAYCGVAIVLVAVSVPLASVPSRYLDAELPGVAVARAYSGRAFEIAIGAGSAASVIGLIVLEFLALGRLWHWLAGTPLRPSLIAVGVPFVLADALSLISPERFYTELLRPSLIALWISQLIVFAAFPLLRLGRGRPFVPAGAALATVACALSGYGLYLAITSSVGS
jgi:amino acid transporter